MDFFNLLRQGASFGNSRKSKHVGFQPTKPTEESKKTASASSSSSGVPAQTKEQKVCPKKDSKEDLGQIRKKNKIQLVNGDGLGLMIEFKSHAPEWAVANLELAKIITPSAIQMQSMTAALGNHHILASAPTGSGKTLAFLLPIITLLKKPKKKSLCRALVIDPSRELALQTLREFERLANGTTWRGCLVDKSETDSESSGCDLAISTPSRLVYLLNEGAFKLDKLKICVLDEADKLLDLGFAPQVDEIMQHIKTHPQLLMFSATLPPPVVDLGESILKNPVRIHVGDQHAASTLVEQKLIFVGREEGKLASLRQLVLEKKLKPPALIFVQSKDRATELFNELVYDGIYADVMHADRTKEERDNVIKGFRAGKIWVLICTDLMARGVDFRGVETIINYDLPQSATTYIHRVGRTGRAGRAGAAFTFFTDRDFDHLNPIINVLKQSGCEVSEWMNKLKKPSRKARKMAEYRPPHRKPISTTPAKDQKVRKWAMKKSKKTE